MIKTKRGLDLPISGSPEQTIQDGPLIRQVALVGHDYPGMKPTMEVREGDQVKAGQLIFTDKKTPGVKFTAPASGKVVAVNRGDKRVFESLVVEVDASAEAETFAAYPASQLRTLERDKVVENLVESGEWTAIRTRPFSKIPQPDAPSPDALFLTASSSIPLLSLILISSPSIPFFFFFFFFFFLFFFFICFFFFFFFKQKTAYEISACLVGSGGIFFSGECRIGPI